MSDRGNARDDEEQDAVLATWGADLTTALELDLDADVDAILALAGVAARAVVRPAAPLTTFLVGYAAGQAAERGANPAQAVDDAAATARKLATDRRRDE